MHFKMFQKQTQSELTDIHAKGNALKCTFKLTGSITMQCNLLQGAKRVPRGEQRMKKNFQRILINYKQNESFAIKQIFA